MQISVFVEGIPELTLIQLEPVFVVLSTTPLAPHIQAVVDEGVEQTERRAVVTPEVCSLHCD